MLKHLDLFSGIGGFALAAQIVGGIQTKQFVEIDPYCQRVLSKNFSGVPVHGCITTFTVQPGSFDLITGGFPCQGISSANRNGRGLEDKRSGLFYELMRIVRECRPSYLVLENVSEMLRKDNGRVMGTVLFELSESGYDAEWQTISAASMGAPHLRERVFIIAYPKGTHDQRIGRAVAEKESEAQDDGVVVGGSSKDAANAHSARREKFNASSVPAIARYSTGALIERGEYWKTEPGILRVVDGVSSRLERIRGCGNAIVPQCGAIALQRVLEIHRGCA